MALTEPRQADSIPRSMSDATEASRPPLSVVIPTRDGLTDLGPVLDALLQEAARAAPRC
jgi:hypothetical protein